MTQIGKTEGIRELTTEEISAVAGGTGQSNLLSCVLHQIQSIICKVESFLSCFCRPPVTNCFTGITQVLMADGTTRSIAAVKIGDEVIGENGEVNKVIGIKTPVLGGRKLYAFNDGPAFVTPEHPFMTRSGWKSMSPKATLAENGNFSVGALKAGDDMVRLAAVATRAMPMTGTFGGSVPPSVEVLIETKFSALDSITPHHGDPSMIVYNLRLDGNHTFFANTYLVHNLLD